MRRSVLFLGGLLLSCRPATEGRFQSIEANIKSLRSVSGYLPTKGTDIPFTAYFQQMDLQLVEERPVLAQPVRNRYYFHKGELFYFRRLQENTLERQFVVDKHGHVRNSIPAPFPPDEYSQTSSRALELKAAAVLRAGQMFVFPLMRNPQ